MRLINGFVLVAIFLKGSSASRIDRRHVLHETRQDLGSAEWVKQDALSKTMLLPMRVGLTQRNLDKGYDMLMDVSDPNSPHYGKYYSAKEIQGIFSPSVESVKAVRSWLQAKGIRGDRISQSHNKQWIQFDATTAEAESLLHTSFYIYKHKFSGRQAIGCDKYYVHESVQEHVDYITPGVKFLGAQIPTSRRESVPLEESRVSDSIDAIAKSETSGNLTLCDQYMTPKCVQAMYALPPPTSSVAGNDLGVYEDGSWVDTGDLDMFYQYVAPEIPNGTFPIFKSIDGAPDLNSLAHGVSGEANLDFQVSYPQIWPQQAVVFQTNDIYYTLINGSLPGLYNNFLDAIDGSYCNYSAFGETGNNPIDPSYPDPHKHGYKGQLECGVFKPTNVISFSYGQTELGGTVPRNYQERQCNEYMKLGMQGVSIVFASADFGAACFKGVFSPYFPANCPYVTSVGATTLPPGASAQKDQEQATTAFGSGGGFSNYFARPQYQQSTLQTYFNSSSAPKLPYYTNSTIGDGVYNRSGRGIPDVAAVGQNIVFFSGGYPSLGSGTSASTPLFAAILTRINGERLKAGKPAVGFVNPLMYQNPHAFHDIIVGNNDNLDYCKHQGFNASVGWDPVTGLGTPNYPLLLEAFMKAAK